MAKAEIEELQKHTLKLFKGDYERIGELVPDCPPAMTIRHLIRAYINKLSPPPSTKLKASAGDHLV